MRRHARLLLALALTLAFALGATGGSCGQPNWTNPHEPVGHELFASPQAAPLALSPDGSRLYVAKTTAGAVTVIDTASRTVLVDNLRVGLDPVSVAVRPDGSEVWVANHVSDSVSVIDTNPASATYHRVVATIQDLQGGITDFDEPVGVAFADDTKAYVALSSTNRIAIVDVATRSVTGHVAITAQDPRAIAVRDGRLYVLAFESGNQSEMSICAFAIPGDPQCTMDAGVLAGMAGTNPNLPGVPKNVVRDPDVPDRDLFVVDTATDQLLGSVTNVGTLLYGLAVSHTGHQVFVANTDARNHHLDGNGLAAPPPDGLGLGLADLDNRLFRNRITVVDCGSGSPCGAAAPADLEEPPGSPVATPLATPYGIAISADDSLLVLTAAASSRIATVDASSPGLAGVLDTLDVGAIPRGLAFDSSGSTGTAWVLNTLGNSVSVVDVGSGGLLSPAGTIPLSGDPTPEAVRLGRIAFNDANGSSSGTFACASCHPDAGNDQLMWVIGATCDDCDQEEARSTMPVRGLENTLPLHWDGTLGDPFGGINGEVGTGGAAAPSCDAGDPQTCFADLVTASMSGVMCTQPTCPVGPSGDPGEMTATERDDMATFLRSVAYAPARSRPISDLVSQLALDGFSGFFMDQGGGGNSETNTCADTTGGCHALPLGASTNSIAVGGFEAPTMRGMTDRFLHFSGGFTIPQEVLDILAANGGSFGVIPWNPADGLDELVVFSAGFVAFQPVYNVLPVPLFQMFEEASTGTSGAAGRQVTLSVATTTGGAAAATYALLDDLVDADARVAVNLSGDGLHDGTPVTVSYKAHLDLWQVGPQQLTRAQLETEVESGALVATLTGYLPQHVGDPGHPQPLLLPATTGNGATGDPPLPVLPGDNPMDLTGVDVRGDAALRVDGQPVGGTVQCLGGSFDPFCSTQLVRITLSATPANGAHLLQVQNGRGPLSNELPICVGPVGDCL